MKVLWGSLAALVALCVSCTPPAASPEELAAALGTVSYDQDVMADLSRYEALSKFLQAHIDTLITTRDAMHMVTFVQGSRDGHRDTTYAVPVDCHLFFEQNEQYDLHTAPTFLRKQLDSLYHQFSAKRISSFEVCSEGRVVIGIHTDHITQTLEATHELIWDPNGQPDRPRTKRYILDKDTLLPPGCIYRIGLIEDRGW
ncbi:MAG: hypothetical protein IPI81_09610 [Flavobacteriales bacterium]|nr:hypothetical protein [Flavobacteriales bacterium]MCC6939281.1 hypothetical protein [Flavobacteriales bacterium]